MKKVVYRDTFDEQVRWGGCADPRKVLTPGQEYMAERIEVHGWHTKLFLQGHDKGFPLFAFDDKNGKCLEIKDFGSDDT